jgi:signal transduction histidine kinase/CheY-like chemotaxis protein
MDRAQDLTGYLTTLTVFTIAYVATGMVGLFIQTGLNGITPIWPPSGIALFAFCRYGPRMWPVVGLGIAFLAWHQGIPPSSAAIASAGNISEAWLGSYLIRNFRINIGQRFRDAWLFLLLPALLAPLSAATIGTLGLVLGGVAPWGSVDLIWFMWWLGDVCGIVLFLPLLDAWWRRPKRWSTKLRLAEWLAVVSFSIFIGWYTFHGIHDHEFHGATLLQFLIMPFVLWAAIRLGLRGVTMVSVIACSWVLWGAARSSGPFEIDNSVFMGLMESSFILVVTFTGLIVQGLFREHSLDMEEIRSARDKLEERVRDRTADLDNSNMKLHQEIKEKEISEKALKKSEQQLHKAKKTADLANKAKSRFLAAASHDLRQPLQAISSNIDLLTINNTDPALARPIQQLSDATRAMQELLEGLLDVSKLDSGSMKPEIRPFSLSTLLDQLREQYQSIATEKGITLKHVPCTAVVRSDPTLLRVILQNLISNAIKYTYQGKVIIGCRYRGDRLRIEVWDSGTGIPEDAQETIFEEFHQLDNPSRNRERGVGIGLSIVKRMATLLKHPLYMHSIVGKGSSFTIEVPLVDRAQEEAPAAQPVIAKPDSESEAVSILLIEDDEIVLHANHGLLETLGYKVIPVSDAETAMTWIESESPPPDIIITDYRLPGDCVGTELIKKLRKTAGSLIPSIILTGDITISNDKNHLLDNSLLLQKPARVQDLVQAITQLLGNAVPSA